MIREVAVAAGAQVAELYGELEAGQYVGGPDCLHPDQDGHAGPARGGRPGTAPGVMDCTCRTATVPRRPRGVRR